MGEYVLPILKSLLLGATAVMVCWFIPFLSLIPVLLGTAAMVAIQGDMSTFWFLFAILGYPFGGYVLMLMTSPKGKRLKGFVSLTGVWLGALFGSSALVRVAL